MKVDADADWQTVISPRIQAAATCCSIPEPEPELDEPSPAPERLPGAATEATGRAGARQKQLRELEEQKKAAVAAENFEECLRLRDKIAAIVALTDTEHSPVDSALVVEHRQCDACPHCNDICSDSSCTTCAGKAADIASESGDAVAKGKRQYTRCQIRRHCTPDSLWLVAHKRVADVTRFIGAHPGGQSAILKHGGMEVRLH